MKLGRIDNAISNFNYVRFWKWTTWWELKIKKKVLQIQNNQTAFGTNLPSPPSLVIKNKKDLCSTFSYKKASHDPPDTESPLSLSPHKHTELSVHFPPANHCNLPDWSCCHFHGVLGALCVCLFHSFSKQFEVFSGLLKLQPLGFLRGK